MPIRHTWTLLLLLVVALAPASAKQEQLCHELISALQSDTAIRAATGVADEESARRFLSSLLGSNAGILCAASGESSTLVKAMWLGERLDWIETDAVEWNSTGEPGAKVRNALAQALWHAPSAEVEWCREFLAEP